MNNPLHLNYVMDQFHDPGYRELFPKVVKVVSRTLYCVSGLLDLLKRKEGAGDSAENASDWLDRL